VIPPSYLSEKPIGRIHFAGTEAGTKWWGNIEAALEAGELASGPVNYRRAPS
jgi:monoamine oxidase